MRTLSLLLILLCPSIGQAANVAFVDWTTGAQNSRSTTSVITKTTTAGNTGVVQVWECAKGSATAVVPTVADTGGSTWTQRATVTQSISYGTTGAYMRCYVFTTGAGGILGSTSVTVTWSSAIPGTACAGLYQVSNCAAIGGISTKVATDASSINANIPMTCENNNLVLAMLGVWDVGSYIATRTGSASVAQWIIINNSGQNDEFWMDNERQTIATQGAATVGYTTTGSVPLMEMITIEMRNGSSANTLTPTNTPTDTPVPTNTNTPTYTNTSTNTNTSTPSYTSTASPTSTNSATSTRSPTSTDTQTSVFTSTSTPSKTSTVTPTASPSNTSTVSPTSTITKTWTSVDVCHGAFYVAPTRTPAPFYFAVAERIIGPFAAIDGPARAAVLAIAPTEIPRPTPTSIPRYTPGMSPGAIYQAADGTRFLALYPGEPVPAGYLERTGTRSRTLTGSASPTPTATRTPSRTSTPTRTP